MNKRYSLTLAVCTASCLAFAQDTVTSQKTETRQTGSGATSTKTTTKVSTTQYVDQMRTVYTSAGIEEARVARIIELERRLYDAYLAGDVAEVRRIRLEIRRLLGQDVTRVHTYIQSHPLPATFPDFVVNTYAPEASFTRDITISGGGGVSATTGGGVDVNVNRTGTAGTAGTVSGSTTGGTAGTSTDTNVSGSSSSPAGTSTGSGSVTGTGSTGTTGGSSTSGSTGSGTSTGGTSTGSTGGTSTGGTSSGSTGGTSTGGTSSGSTGSTQ